MDYSASLCYKSPSYICRHIEAGVPMKGQVLPLLADVLCANCKQNLPGTSDALSV